MDNSHYGDFRATHAWSNVPDQWAHVSGQGNNTANPSPPANGQNPVAHSINPNLQALRTMQPLVASSSHPLSTAPRSRSPRLIFEGYMDAVLRHSFSTLRKSVPWFPMQARDVRISTPASIEGGSAGICEWDDQHYRRTGTVKISIRVKVEPGKPLTPEYLASVLYVFAHELGDHALGYAVSLSQGKLPLPEMVDHKKVFSPSDETNAWHQVVKSNLRHIDVPHTGFPDAQAKTRYVHALKVAFLKEYATDVENHCIMDYNGRDDEDDDRYIYARGDDDLFDKGMAWAQTLKAKAAYPDDPFWTTGIATDTHASQHIQSGTEQHAHRAFMNAPGYSSGEEAAAESNPMRTTVDDLHEAIDYVETMDDRDRDSRY